MNKQAIALLSLGHFLIDFCQGVVPALVPFLVVERHFSYTAAASLVFAISATSSVVQPALRPARRSTGAALALTGERVPGGGGLSVGAQSANYRCRLDGVWFEWAGCCGLSPGSGP